jgi:Mn2+/Fe2+ NRAMP family transporter
VLQIIVALLLGANVINIGSDLGAMGDAVWLLIGGPKTLYVVLFAIICAALQIFVHYSRYVAALKWMTLSLFAYFGTILVVHVPWLEVARGLFIPTLTADLAFWTTVVAIFGTTISPYLFFWQASLEVERSLTYRSGNHSQNRLNRDLTRLSALSLIRTSVWRFQISLA